jgi:leucyl/phenylalanyl-tRNA--protein transferase
MDIECRRPSLDRDTEARRALLFRETPLQTLQRWTLGTIWALKPEQVVDLPALVRIHLRYPLSAPGALPDPEAALGRSGLCAIADDLSVPALVAGYRRGLYPFAHLGPLKWMSPPERCILAFSDFHMSRRLRARLRQARHRVTFDRDFDAVIKACAAKREGKWHLTWITPRIMHAFAALHDAGHAHSFEVWNPVGELVGGGYGVAVGGAFTIESQFARESHASKIGFAVLNWHLARWGFLLNDNKGPTRNCLEAGFRMVPRGRFASALRRAALLPGRIGRWETEADLATVAAWQPGLDGLDVNKDSNSALEPATRSIAARHATLLPLVDVLDGKLLNFAGQLAAFL